MVLSFEPLIIFVPSGLYATELTLFECPSKVLVHEPLFASHILILLSPEPLTIYFPLGLYATEFTSPECPCKVLVHEPLFASHILIL